MGHESHAFLLFDKNDSSVEVKDQVKIAESYGVRIAYIDDVANLEAYFQQNSSPKIIIDAIFGTGVRLPLSQFLYDVIHLINQESTKINTVQQSINPHVQNDDWLFLEFWDN
jgi:NAD(P)H-hydrate epimerase